MTCRLTNVRRRLPKGRARPHADALDPAPNLGGALGIELWIKREDCTGRAFGGNKVRQLEFYLGEARARGADTVLVTGALQSNLGRLACLGERTHPRGHPDGPAALGEAVAVHGICVRPSR